MQTLSGLVLMGMMSGLCLWAAPLAADESDCLFKGQLLSAAAFDHVRVRRKGEAEPLASVGAHTPLYAGDSVEVLGSEDVIIAASPHDPYQVITKSDGRVIIAEHNICDGRAGAGGIWSNLIPTLQAVLAAPVSSRPVTTMPKRSLFCGVYSQKGIVLDLDDEQLLVAGQDRLGVHWLGLLADVRVAADHDAAPLFEASAADLMADMPLRRAIAPGEGLTLQLASALGSVTRQIRVVPPEALPRPPKIADLVPSFAPSLAVQSPWEVLYAIWLATEAPPQWHLQGMSLLHRAAPSDPVAEKALHALWAEQKCTDDF